MRQTRSTRWWIVGGLALVELLVCVGIVLALWTARAGLGRLRLFYVADTHVEETLEEVFVVDGPAVLDLDADFSDVTVTGSEGDEVEVVARLSLWGTDEADARRQVDVQMSQEGNRIVVRVLLPESIYALVTDTRGSRVDFEVRVPFETALKLVTSSGDVTVRDTAGAMQLDTSFGSIQVEDVSGTLDAQSSSGDVTVAGVSDGGALKAETEFGQLVLRDIDADSLDTHSGSGDVELEGITLAGALDVETNFGGVTVRDVSADHLSARSRSGGILAEEVTLDGALDLEAEFGDVAVRGTDAAAYRLSSGSGSLTLDGCGGPLDLQAEFGDIEVTDATEAELALNTNSGGVYFSGSLSAEGEHRVESGFGDVHLLLPADAAFDLDADTEFGSIETDFAVTMTEFDANHIVGQVNGGGPLLWVHTNSGGITLERMAGGSN